MLVNALTELEDLMKQKKYADVAQKLGVVKQISATFQGYTGVPRIAKLWRRINDLQGQLRSQLEIDFDSLYASSSLFQSLSDSFFELHPGHECTNQA